MLLVTPHRRATWDRMKVEQHPYYLHVLREGAKDNTTGQRYVSNGRWSGLAYQMSGDPAFALRSYDHVKLARVGDTFETAALLTSNTLREHATEFVITLSWIQKALSTEQITSWRSWLIRSADAALVGTIRYNDSDQVVGTYFFLAALDKHFGTAYLTHPKSVLMRESIRKFCTVYAKGGQWPEGSEYSWGTVNLLFTGAEAAGLEDYPDVVAYRAELTRYIFHTFTPDLKDMFEHGDEQSPHDPHWLALETVLAYLGSYSPEIRQFEDDLRTVWNRPAGAPFYSRWFIWTDPYADRKPWKDFAGTYAVSPGVGQVLSRESWEPDAGALHLWFPPFSAGVLDHAYPIFGELRFRKDKKWLRDRPIAYSGSLKLGNHTIIAGMGAPGEVGVFNGATRIAGKATYGSGTNAGVFAAKGRYLPPKTLLHEKTVTFIWLEDLGVHLKIERIHLDETDPALLAPYAETVDKPKIVAASLIETLWQSQTVKSTVVNGVIVDDWRVQPLYPCTIEVIDQDPLSLGTITPTEKGYYSSVKPLEVKKFQILVTLIGEPATVTTTTAIIGDVHKTHVIKPGFRDKVIYSSAKPGPVLQTTRVGSVAAHDATKIDGILAARAVTVDPAWADVDADVYVEQADGLVALQAAPVKSRQWRGTETPDGTMIVLERVP